MFVIKTCVLLFFGFLWLIKAEFYAGQFMAIQIIGKWIFIQFSLLIVELYFVEKIRVLMDKIKRESFETLNVLE